MRPQGAKPRLRRIRPLLNTNLACDRRELRAVYFSAGVSLNCIYLAGVEPFLIQSCVRPQGAKLSFTPHQAPLKYQSCVQPQGAKRRLFPHWASLTCTYLAGTYLLLIQSRVQPRGAKLCLRRIRPLLNIYLACDRRELGAVYVRTGASLKCIYLTGFEHPRSKDRGPMFEDPGCPCRQENQPHAVSGARPKGIGICPPGPAAHARSAGSHFKRCLAQGRTSEIKRSKTYVRFLVEVALADLFHFEAQV